MIDSLRLDLRYAIRTIAKTPAFSALLILILALGIGANTAMFSIVDAVLFRPLPASHPEQLVGIWGYDSNHASTYNLSFPGFKDFRDQAKSFQAVAAYTEWNEVNVSTLQQKARRVEAAIVTGNYFGLLGIHAYRGRVIAPSDDQAKGQSPVLLLSHRFWKSYFDSANVIGKQIHVNGSVFLIIGVAPPEFIGTELEHAPDVWMPMSMVDVFLPEFASMNPLSERRFGWLDAIGRLKPGVTLTQAETELNTIVSRVEKQPTSRSRRRFGAKLFPANTALIDVEGNNSVAKISWLLFGATLLVLLVAIVVASGLLLVKAEQRQREIAVRLAMGASRNQIIRQLMIESFVISLIAAAAGMLFAVWCTDLLAGVVGDQGFTLPVNAATPILNLRVLIVTVFVSSITALLFGLVPALLSSRASLLPALKKEAIHAGRNRAFSLKNVFIVAQVAFCILLMTGAGLLLRTLWKARAVQPGFNTKRAVVASVDLAKQGYSEAQQKVFFGTMFEKLSATPGIHSVALAKTVPVQVDGMRLTFDDSGLESDFNIITPGFFKTLNIPVIQGRDFQSSDLEKSTQVAIVNEAMARRFWPDQPAIGKILKNVGGEKAVQIVGVVPDVKFKSLREPAEPMLFVPLTQWNMSEMTIVASGDLAPQAALMQIQRAMEQLDKTLPLFKTKTLTQKLEQSLIQERVLAGLLMIFGMIALLLAAVGLYSLLSFVTETRTREIGIRMAIGAKRIDVLKTFLSRGIVLTAAGIGAGVLASLGASRVLETLLFSVTRFDAWTYAGIVIVMMITSFAASYFPARRAANLDPVQALRYE